MQNSKLFKIPVLAAAAMVVITIMISSSYSSVSSSSSSFIASSNENTTFYTGRDIKAGILGSLLASNVTNLEFYEMVPR